MKNTHHDIPPALAQALRQARRVVVFTGAGVSAESGIATFRDALTGLWSRFDAQALATPEAFAADPDIVWGWYEWRRAQVLRAAPNAAHRAIADLARHVPELAVITQNVDDLHERAGSPRILHLLGRFDQPRCSACAMPYTLAAPPAKPGRQGPFPPPPACRICGNLVRPGRLWHGEPPASDVWAIAKGLAASADLILAVGTSCETPAAAEFCYAAMADGAELVQINPNPTLLDRVAAHNIKGPAEKILPLLLARAWPGA